MDIVKHTYPKDMDPEMVEICDCLNSFNGVRTTNCCFGHGDPIGFYLAMCISDMHSLKNILQVFSNHYKRPETLGLKYGTGFETNIDAIGAENNPAKENEIAIFVYLHNNLSIYKQPTEAMTTCTIKNIVKELQKYL